MGGVSRIPSYSWSWAGVIVANSEHKQKHTRKYLVDLPIVLLATGSHRPQGGSIVPE